MAFEYRLHDVGEGIDAAEVLEWHAAVGDEVTEDQSLVDVQTDKAMVTLPCPTDGVVLELRWSVGDMVPVGEVLAVFGDRAELEAAARGAAGAAPADAAAAAADTLAAPSDAQASADVQGARGDAAVAPADAALAAAFAAGRPLASPAVRLLARGRGVDLTRVRGGGPHGRILSDDVLLAADGDPADGGGAAADAVPARPLPPAAPAPGARRKDEVVPLRGTRRAIARNLTRSWQEIPHIVDFREVDAAGLISARNALRAKAESDGDAQLAKLLTPLALLAKIAATVVRRHPRVNSSVDMEGEEITLYGQINLSIAIAAPDGLVTPVVRNADAKPVPTIARDIAELATVARERRLSPEQLAGGTVTVNNFGVLGSPYSTPIIPPGQALNLGFGRMQEKPVARDGEVVVRPVLGISCSGDHRVLDGKDLSYFVNDVVAAIENPILLLGELA